MSFFGRTTSRGELAVKIIRHRPSLRRRVADILRRFLPWL